MVRIPWWYTCRPSSIIEFLIEERRKAEFWECLSYKSCTWYWDMAPGCGGPRWLPQALAVRRMCGPPFFSSRCHHV